MTTWLKKYKVGGIKFVLLEIYRTEVVRKYNSFFYLFITGLYSKIQELKLHSRFSKDT